MKGRFDQALTIGWQSERFTRTKRMKDLDAYLKPKTAVEDKRENGAAAVGAMLNRLARKAKA